MQIRSNPLGSFWNKYISVIRINKSHICVCLLLIVMGCTGNDPNTSYKEGLEFKRKGDFEQARRLFLNAIDLSKDYSRAYFEIGNIYYIQEKYDSSIKYYITATSHDTSFARAYLGLGLSYVKLGNIEKSIEYCQKSITHYDPADTSLNKTEFSKAYYSIGKLLSRKKEYILAINYYLKAILYDSSYAPAYFNIGASYYNLGDMLKSIEYYQKSLNYMDSSEKGMTYSVLGSIYFQLENNVLARDAYLNALKFEGNSVFAFYGLGRALAGLNKWKDAKAAFQNAIRLNPNDEMVKSSLELCNLIIDDPAYLKLSQQEHNYLKYVFENASYTFQFVIKQNIMPYDEFLRLNLDQQIKKCNQLKKSFNMESFVFSYALQEWLRIDAKTASTIISY